MDMKIAGSGNIPSGEYESVTTAGSARLYGLVRCKDFSSAGSVHGEAIECENEFNTAGSGHFEGSIKSGSVSTKGSLRCDGDIIADGTLKMAGSARCSGSLKGTSISLSGSVTVVNDVEAEKIKVTGVINCEGLINAEDVAIYYSDSMDIGSIGGSKILIESEKERYKKRHSVNVKSSIEGDEIEIEGVDTPRVSGKTVKIGDYCNIELVQYSDAFEASPKSKIGTVEKI